MTTETDTRLTPARRLTRGLARTVAGPVDVTCGTVGLVAQSIGATVGGLRAQYRRSKVRKELRNEVAEARGLVSREFTALEDAVHTLAETTAREHGPQRKRLLYIGAAVAALAGGGVVFAIVRRSRRPEPAPLPPSVPVEPAP